MKALKSVKAAIELGRPLNAMMVFLGVLVGGFIAETPVNLLLPAAISATLISMGAQAVNDYFDLEVDKRKGKQSPLVRGTVSSRFARRVWLFYFITGTMLGFLTSVAHGIVALITSSLSYLYSRYVQKRKYLGNVLVSFLVGLSLVYGGLGGKVEKTLIPALIAFFVNWGREILKDITDAKADFPYKISLVHVLGRQWANFFASYMVFLGIILTPFPYLMGHASDLYVPAMGIASMIALLGLTRALQHREKEAERILKWAMMFALIAFAVGAIG